MISDQELEPSLIIHEGWGLIRGVNLISEVKSDVYLNVNLISVRSTKGQLN